MLGYQFVFIALGLCVAIEAFCQQSASIEHPLFPTTEQTTNPVFFPKAASHSFKSSSGYTLEATTIEPYRYADLGPDVEGILDRLACEEGDYVEQGQVMAEISPSRYRILVEKARENVQSLEFAFALAVRQVGLLRELFAQDATTRQDLLKAEAERDATESRWKAAKKELELSQLNLHACQLKAPFSGYVALIFKRSFEPVNRLEKILRLVDSSKVYAVANVEQDLLQAFPRGAPAAFVAPSGKTFSGTVAKVGKIIDVKSNTKKVYVLIDNSSSELEIGMTGTLRHLSETSD